MAVMMRMMMTLMMMVMIITLRTMIKDSGRMIACHHYGDGDDGDDHDNDD